MPSHWLYALLCVVVPGAWGLVVYWASTWIERRALGSSRFPSADAEENNGGNALPLDYHI